MSNYNYYNKNKKPKLISGTHILKIISVIFASFIGVFGATILVMYLAGSFEDKRIPPDGIKIEISEENMEMINGKQYYVPELIQDNGAYSFSFNVLDALKNVKDDENLEYRPQANYLDLTVQIADERVLKLSSASPKMGEPITFEVQKSPDGYIQGGYTQITIRSADGVYGSTSVDVFIDVPVQGLTNSVVKPNTLTEQNNNLTLNVLAIDDVITFLKPVYTPMRSSDIRDRDKTDNVSDEKKWEYTVESLVDSEETGSQNWVNIDSLSSSDGIVEWENSILRKNLRAVKTGIFRISSFTYETYQDQENASISEDVKLVRSQYTYFVIKEISFAKIDATNDEHIFDFSVNGVRSREDLITYRLYLNTKKSQNELKRLNAVNLGLTLSLPEGYFKTNNELLNALGDVYLTYDPLSVNPYYSINGDTLRSTTQLYPIKDDNTEYTGVEYYYEMKLIGKQTIPVDMIFNINESKSSTFILNKTIKFSMREIPSTLSFVEELPLDTESTYGNYQSVSIERGLNDNGKTISIMNLSLKATNAVGEQEYVDLTRFVRNISSEANKLPSYDHIKYYVYLADNDSDAYERLNQMTISFADGFLGNSVIEIVRNQVYGVEIIEGKFAPVVFETFEIYAVLVQTDVDGNEVIYTGSNSYTYAKCSMTARVRVRLNTATMTVFDSDIIELENQYQLKENYDYFIRLQAMMNGDIVDDNILREYVDHISFEVSVRDNGISPLEIDSTLSLRNEGYFVCVRVGSTMLPNVSKNLSIACIYRDPTTRENIEIASLRNINIIDTAVRGITILNGTRNGDRQELTLQAGWNSAYNDGVGRVEWTATNSTENIDGNSLELKVSVDGENKNYDVTSSNPAVVIESKNFQNVLKYWIKIEPVISVSQVEIVVTSDENSAYYARLILTLGVPEITFKLDDDANGFATTYGVIINENKDEIVKEADKSRYFHQIYSGQSFKFYKNSQNSPKPVLEAEIGGTICNNLLKFGFESNESNDYAQIIDDANYVEIVFVKNPEQTKVITILIQAFSQTLKLSFNLENKIEIKFVDVQDLFNPSINSDPNSTTQNRVVMSQYNDRYYPTIIYTKSAPLNEITLTDLISCTSKTGESFLSDNIKYTLNGATGLRIDGNKITTESNNNGVSEPKTFTLNVTVSQKLEINGSDFESSVTRSFIFLEVPDIQVFGKSMHNEKIEKNENVLTKETNVSVSDRLVKISREDAYVFLAGDYNYYNAGTFEDGAKKNRVYELDSSARLNEKLLLKTIGAEDDKEALFTLRTFSGSVLTEVDQSLVQFVSGLRDKICVQTIEFSWSSKNQATPNATPIGLALNQTDQVLEINTSSILTKKIHTVYMTLNFTNQSGKARFIEMSVMIEVEPYYSITFNNSNEIQKLLDLADGLKTKNDSENNANKIDFPENSIVLYKNQNIKLKEILSVANDSENSTYVPNFTYRRGSNPNNMILINNAQYSATAELQANIFNGFSYAQVSVYYSNEDTGFVLNIFVQENADTSRENSINGLVETRIDSNQNNTNQVVIGDTTYYLVLNNSEWYISKNQDYESEDTLVTFNTQTGVVVHNSENYIAKDYIIGSSEIATPTEVTSLTAFDLNQMYKIYKLSAENETIDLIYSLENESECSSFVSINSGYIRFNDCAKDILVSLKIDASRQYIDDNGEIKNLEFVRYFVLRKTQNIEITYPFENDPTVFLANYSEDDKSESAGEGAIIEYKKGVVGYLRAKAYDTLTFSRFVTATNSNTGESILSDLTLQLQSYNINNKAWQNSSLYTPNTEEFTINSNFSQNTYTRIHITSTGGIDAYLNILLSLENECNPKLNTNYPSTTITNVTDNEPYERREKSFVGKEAIPMFTQDVNSSVTRLSLHGITNTASRLYLEPYISEINNEGEASVAGISCDIQNGILTVTKGEGYGGADFVVRVKIRTDYDYYRSGEKIQTYNFYYGNNLVIEPKVALLPGGYNSEFSLKENRAENIIDCLSYFNILMVNGAHLSLNDITCNIAVKDASGTAYDGLGYSAYLDNLRGSYMLDVDVNNSNLPSEGVYVHITVSAVDGVNMIESTYILKVLPCIASIMNNLEEGEANALSSPALLGSTLKKVGDSPTEVIEIDIEDINFFGYLTDVTNKTYEWLAPQDFSIQKTGNQYIVSKDLKNAFKIEEQTSDGVLTGWKILYMDEVDSFEVYEPTTFEFVLVVKNGPTEVRKISYFLKLYPKIKIAVNQNSSAMVSGGKTYARAYSGNLYSLTQSTNALSFSLGDIDSKDIYKSKTDFTGLDFSANLLNTSGEKLESLKVYHYIVKNSDKYYLSEDNAYQADKDKEISVESVNNIIIYDGIETTGIGADVYRLNSLIFADNQGRIYGELIMSGDNKGEFHSRISASLYILQINARVIGATECHKDDHSDCYSHKSIIIRFDQNVYSSRISVKSTDDLPNQSTNPIILSSEKDLAEYIDVSFINTSPFSKRYLENDQIDMKKVLGDFVFESSTFGYSDETKSIFEVSYPDMIIAKNPLYLSSETTIKSVTLYLNGVELCDIYFELGKDFSYTYDTIFDTMYACDTLNLNYLASGLIGFSGNQLSDGTLTYSYVSSTYGTEGEIITINENNILSVNDDFKNKDQDVTLLAKFVGEDNSTYTAKTVLKILKEYDLKSTQDVYYNISVPYVSSEEFNSFLTFTHGGQKQDLSNFSKGITSSKISENPENPSGKIASADIYKVDISVNNTGESTTTYATCSIYNVVNNKYKGSDVLYSEAQVEQDVVGGSSINLNNFLGEFVLANGGWDSLDAKIDGYDGGLLLTYEGIQYSVVVVTETQRYTFINGQKKYLLYHDSDWYLSDDNEIFEYSNSTNREFYLLNGNQATPLGANALDYTPPACLDPYTQYILVEMKYTSSDSYFGIIKLNVQASAMINAQYTYNAQEISVFKALKTYNLNEYLQISSTTSYYKAQSRRGTTSFDLMFYNSNCQKVTEENLSGYYTIDKTVTIAGVEYIIVAEGNENKLRPISAGNSADNDITLKKDVEDINNDYVYNGSNVVQHNNIDFDINYKINFGMNAQNHSVLLKVIYTLPKANESDPSISSTIYYFIKVDGIDITLEDKESPYSMIEGDTFYWGNILSEESRDKIQSLIDNNTIESVSYTPIGDVYEIKEEDNVYKLVNSRNLYDTVCNVIITFHFTGGGSYSYSADFILLSPYTISYKKNALSGNDQLDFTETHNTDNGAEKMALDLFDYIDYKLVEEEENDYSKFGLLSNITIRIYDDQGQEMGSTICGIQDFALVGGTDTTEGDFTISTIQNVDYFTLSLKRDKNTNKYEDFILDVKKKNNVELCISYGWSFGITYAFSGANQNKNMQIKIIRVQNTANFSASGYDGSLQCGEAINLLDVTYSLDGNALTLSGLSHLSFIVSDTEFLDYDNTNKIITAKEVLAPVKTYVFVNYENSGASDANKYYSCRLNITISPRLYGYKSAVGNNIYFPVPLHDDEYNPADAKVVDGSSQYRLTLKKDTAETTIIETGTINASSMQGGDIFNAYFTCSAYANTIPHNTVPYKVQFESEYTFFTTALCLELFNTIEVSSGQKEVRKSEFTINPSQIHLESGTSLFDGSEVKGYNLSAGNSHTFELQNSDVCESIVLSLATTDSSLTQEGQSIKRNGTTLATINGAEITINTGVENAFFPLRVTATAKAPTGVSADTYHFLVYVYVAPLVDEIESWTLGGNLDTVTVGETLPLENNMWLKGTKNGSDVSLESVTGTASIDADFYVGINTSTYVCKLYGVKYEYDINATKSGTTNALIIDIGTNDILRYYDSINQGFSLSLSLAGGSYTAEGVTYSLENNDLPSNITLSGNTLTINGSGVTCGTTYDFTLKATYGGKDHYKDYTITFTADTYDASSFTTEYDIVLPYDSGIVYTGSYDLLNLAETYIQTAGGVKYVYSSWSTEDSNVSVSGGKIVCSELPVGSYTYSSGKITGVSYTELTKQGTLTLVSETNPSNTIEIPLTFNISRTGASYDGAIALYGAPITTTTELFCSSGSGANYKLYFAGKELISDVNNGYEVSEYNRTYTIDVTVNCDENPFISQNEGHCDLETYSYGAVTIRYYTYYNKITILPSTPSYEAVSIVYVTIEGAQANDGTYAIPIRISSGSNKSATDLETAKSCSLSQTGETLNNSFSDMSYELYKVYLKGDDNKSNMFNNFTIDGSGNIHATEENKKYIVYITDMAFTNVSTKPTSYISVYGDGNIISEFTDENKWYIRDQDLGLSARMDGLVLTIDFFKYFIANTFFTDPTDTTGYSLSITNADIKSIGLADKLVLSNKNERDLSFSNSCIITSTYNEDEITLGYTNKVADYIVNQAFGIGYLNSAIYVILDRDGNVRDSSSGSVVIQDNNELSVNNNAVVTFKGEAINYTKYGITIAGKTVYIIAKQATSNQYAYIGPQSKIEIISGETQVLEYGGNNGQVGYFKVNNQVLNPESIYSFELESQNTQLIQIDVFGGERLKKNMRAGFVLQDTSVLIKTLIITAGSLLYEGYFEVIIKSDIQIDVNEFIEIDVGESISLDEQFTISKSNQIIYQNGEYTSSIDLGFDVEYNYTIGNISYDDSLVSAENLLKLTGQLLEVNITFTINNNKLQKVLMINVNRDIFKLSIVENIFNINGGQVVNVDNLHFKLQDKSGYGLSGKPTLKFVCPEANTSYPYTISGDGKTITGLYTFEDVKTRVIVQATNDNSIYKCEVEVYVKASIYAQSKSGDQGNIYNATTNVLRKQNLSLKEEFDVGEYVNTYIDFKNYFKISDVPNNYTFELYYNGKESSSIPFESAEYFGMRNVPLEIKIYQGEYEVYTIDMIIDEILADRSLSKISNSIVYATGNEYKLTDLFAVNELQVGKVLQYVGADNNVISDTSKINEYFEVTFEYEIPGVSSITDENGYKTLVNQNAVQGSLNSDICYLVITDTLTGETLRVQIVLPRESN